MVSVLLSYSLQYGVAVDIAWLFLEKLLLRFQAFDPEKLAVRIYGTSDVAPEIARELEKKTDSRLNKVYIIMRFLLLVIARTYIISVYSSFYRLENVTRFSIHFEKKKHKQKKLLLSFM